MTNQAKKKIEKIKITTLGDIKMLELNGACREDDKDLVLAIKINQIVDHLNTK